MGVGLSFFVLATQRKLTSGLFPPAVAATIFYVTPLTTGKYRFESMEYPGKYLLVDSGELKVGILSNNNEEFTGTVIDTNTSRAYHIPTMSFPGSASGNETNVPTDCYIAFDTNGDKYGACNLSGGDPEVEITPWLVV